MLGKKKKKKLVSLGKIVLAADGRVEDEYAFARAKYADRIKKNNSGAVHMNIVTFV